MMNDKITEEFEYGLCPECNQPNTGSNWCQNCNYKRFQQDLTSGNELIDRFIHDVQLKARNSFEIIIEWIPYNRLRNIQYLAQGGSSTIYKAIWLDGFIGKWNNDKQLKK
ncbi:hypothetical protein C1645_822477 [Glomus cerebriforme]|uniref:Protein kinase domain-containing protein n=1 Tax=Glomus cerebriforme TaxID=658196 RepID=A0A397SYP8_9GLOM|nr:hypothetical protein C1645_822477 [Glomus cerebriforme]